MMEKTEEVAEVLPAMRNEAFEDETEVKVSNVDNVDDSNQSRNPSASSGVVRVGQNMMKGATNVAKSAAQAGNKAKIGIFNTTKEVPKALSKVVPKPRVNNSKNKIQNEEGEEEENGAPIEQQEEPRGSVRASFASEISDVTMDLSTKKDSATPTASKSATTNKVSVPSTIDEQRNYSSRLPSIVVKALESSRSEGSMEDHMILWIVVASVVILQILENFNSICANEIPVSVVMAFMLLGFTIGLEIDEKTLMKEIKINLLGLHETSLTSSSAKLAKRGSFSVRAASSDTDVGTKFTRNPFTRFFRRRQESLQSRTPAKTALHRKQSQDINDEKNKKFDVNLLRRLQRFRSRTESSIPSSFDSVDGCDDATIGAVTGASRRDKSAIKPGSTRTIGSTDVSMAHADVLLKKLNIEPLFQLRGLDVFLADVSEPEMSNHPFLIKNGLRDVPTFMLNFTTQWGNILVYFQMPKWVVNFGESLVEAEDDHDSVRALKRFLNGSDEYRRARLKIMPEILEAAYAIRLMAPKGREITLDKEDFLPTTYRTHDVAGKQCPIMEVTLDLMTNSTMRGMAALVKRYIGGISIDNALVISTPDDQNEKEPEACLGLFRMNHLDVDACPSLPDRFETEGCSMATVDSIRASLLTKSAAQFSSRSIRVST